MMGGDHNMYCSGNQPDGVWQEIQRMATDEDKDGTIEVLNAEIERLRQVCRDAYEVWAGSEGIPEPETAAEAYVYQLLINMRDEVKRGL